MVYENRRYYLKKSSIGGQGVLEGVMMRAPETSALAVRSYNGNIVTKKWATKNNTKKNAFCSLPIVRGVLSFVDMMVAGVQTITDAAKMLDESVEYEPSKFEKMVAKKTGKNVMDVMMVFAVVVAIALAVVLFFIVPNIVTDFARNFISSHIVMNLIDGVIRLLIFFIYLIAISFMGDIKRMFKYHGAEHKTINCYEHELPLTVENVRAQSRLHPRCGTSYMLLVMVISILVFSLFGWSDNPFVRIGIRILMLPIIAGISYEVLKAAARSENLFWRCIRWPGIQLQRLTTKPPEDEMIETAIVAFEMALGEKTDEELEALIQQFDRTKKEEQPEHVVA